MQLPKLYIQHTVTMTPFTYSTFSHKQLTTLVECKTNEEKKKRVLMQKIKYLGQVVRALDEGQTHTHRHTQNRQKTEDL